MGRTYPAGYIHVKVPLSGNAYEAAEPARIDTYGSSSASAIAGGR